jgi:hypothetical protein
MSKQLAHPDTSTIFLMMFSPFAWFSGNRLLKKYDAEPDRWAHQGLVVFSRNTGKVSTFIWAVVFVVLLFGTAGWLL